MRSYLALFALLTIAALILFVPFLDSQSIGPEFAQYFAHSWHRSLPSILHYYVEFDTPWYRPTQSFLPYWIGEMFIDWHNVAGWRLYAIFSALAVCGTIFWLIWTLLPGQKLAAFFASLFFLSNPIVYAVVYEVSAFDFLHVIFTVICVIAFIHGWRATGIRSHAWTLLSCVMYLVALTSKELTLTAPLYLAFVALILHLYEPKPWSAGSKLGREALRLLPFFVLIPLFWFVHVRQIPKDTFSSSGDYRIGFNFPVAAHNLFKYPFWIAREFRFTLDPTTQSTIFKNFRDTFLGAGLIACVLFAWKKLAFERPFQKVALLSLGWILVFLMVPVYSGGYLWHADLAMIGYAILFGAALQELLSRLQFKEIRISAAVGLVVLLTAASWADENAWLERGPHSEAYKIMAPALARPPIPPGQISGPALVYYEDTRALGDWFYGAGSLFKLVYYDPAIHQRRLAKLEDLQPDEAREWLRSKNSFFFRCDPQYEWHDATNEFRTFATRKSREAIYPPVVTELGPAQTRVGLPFNKQPDGSAALSIQGDHFETGAQLIANGRALSTAFGTTHWITASIPADLFAKEGVISFIVKNPNGMQSNTAEFRVVR